MATCTFCRQVTIPAVAAVERFFYAMTRYVGDDAAALGGFDVSFIHRDPARSVLRSIGGGLRIGEIRALGLSAGFGARQVSGLRNEQRAGSQSI